MPLNEQEQKILDEIERQFRAEDPDLVRKATSLPFARLAMGNVRLLAAGIVVGLVLMLATFSFNTIVALVGFVVMVVSATGLVQVFRGAPSGSKQHQEGGVVDAMKNRWPFRR